MDYFPIGVENYNLGNVKSKVAKSNGFKHVHEGSTLSEDEKNKIVFFVIRHEIEKVTGSKGEPNLSLALAGQKFDTLLSSPGKRKYQSADYARVCGTRDYSLKTLALRPAPVEVQKDLNPSVHTALRKLAKEEREAFLNDDWKSRSSQE